MDENRRPAASCGAVTSSSGVEIPTDWTRDGWVRYADRLLAGARVPYLERSAHAGHRYAALIGLVGGSALYAADDPSPTSVSFDGDSVAVMWPDGRRTAVDLMDFRNVAVAGRQEGGDQDWSQPPSLKEEHLS